MVDVQISEHLDQELQQAADRAGVSKSDLLHELLTTCLIADHDPHFEVTDELAAKLKRSVAQVERGEVYTSEQVDQFFADWFKELDAR